MNKTLLVLILSISSTFCLAGPEPSKSIFGYPFKVNTDLIEWGTALNAEIEFITSPNVTVGLGTKVGVIGTHAVVNGRYYFNDSLQESAFLRSYISLPVLTGGDVGFGAFGGYQFVFDRKYFAQAQLGTNQDFKLDAEITLGISF